MEPNANVSPTPATQPAPVASPHDTPQWISIALLAITTVANLLAPQFAPAIAPIIQLVERLPAVAADATQSSTPNAAVTKPATAVDAKPTNTVEVLIHVTTDPPSTAQPAAKPVATPSPAGKPQSAKPLKPATIRVAGVRVQALDIEPDGYDPLTEQLGPGAEQILAARLRRINAQLDDELKAAMARDPQGFAERAAELLETDPPQPAVEVLPCPPPRIAVGSQITLTRDTPYYAPNTKQGGKAAGVFVAHTVATIVRIWDDERWLFVTIPHTKVAGWIERRHV